MNQEWKLQAVRACPEKDLGVLLPRESSGASGPSSGSPLKRKGIDRQVIGTCLSSRSTPPLKVARKDGASRGASPSMLLDVTPPTATPPVETRVCSHQATPSATTVTLESPSLATPSAPRLHLPHSGTSTGVPSWAGPMIGNPLVIREKLERFVFPPEVTQINTLGTEGIINTFLEGLAQASTASICLLSRARSHGQLKQDNEAMHKELSAAQGKIASLEAVGRASEVDLVAARERTTRLETELSKSHERVAKVEAELEKTRERASLGEAELAKARERASLGEAELAKARERATLREAAMEAEMKVAHERASQAEERVTIAEQELANGLADAFIDGYEELREKISAAFPDLDLSGFVPTEAPDEGNGGSDDTEDGDEDEEDGEDSCESD